MDNVVVRFRAKKKAPEIDVAVVKSPTSAVHLEQRHIVPSDRGKLVLVVGMGQTGKSTLLRWVVERSQERDGTILATLAPNETLARYFPDTLKPDSKDGGFQFLEEFLSVAVESQSTAVIDFGGGDTTLARVLNEAPDLPELIENAGMELVVLYVMSHREDDITPLAELSALGLMPKATAIILNKGRTADPTRPAEAEFDRIVEHSVYLAAKHRGATTIWMPRLYSAKAIEDRRLLFGDARDGKGGDLQLGMIDRVRTGHWLREMEAAFAPIASWLP